VSPPTSTVHNAAYERGARTVLALYANPATPEAVIRKHGLQTRQELLVALARQAKGQVLLTALIKALNSPRLMSQTERDTLMLPLLAEPALRARHLHAITAARTTIASTAHTALMGGPMRPRPAGRPEHHQLPVGLVGFRGNPGGQNHRVAHRCGNQLGGPRPGRPQRTPALGHATNPGRTSPGSGWSPPGGPN